MLDSGIDQVFGVPEITEIAERIIVAPCSGRFRPLPPEVFTSEGEWARRGQMLAEIHNGDDSIPVVSSFSGWVMGMLAFPGGPVEVGHPLFWIRP